MQEIQTEQDSDSVRMMDDCMLGKTPDLGFDFASCLETVMCPQDVDTVDGPMAAALAADRDRMRGYVRMLGSYRGPINEAVRNVLVGGKFSAEELRPIVLGAIPVPSWPEGTRVGPIQRGAEKDVLDLRSLINDRVLENALLLFKAGG